MLARHLTMREFLDSSRCKMIQYYGCESWRLMLPQRRRAQAGQRDVRHLVVAP